jgi:DNA repair protein SbcD/Mre11
VVRVGHGGFLGQLYSPSSIPYTQRAMRVCLTSDLHLGMKFAGYPSIQSTLAEARFDCLKRIVTVASAEECDVVVIAGDLFERVGAARRDIQRAAETFEGFSGRLIAVMPGNHDYVAQGDPLWPVFKDSCPDAVLVLDQPRPYPLAHYDIDACLYPGPCSSKHAPANAIGWVRSAAKDAAVRHHIGIAHGSLEGFSPDMDGRYYPMTPEELLAAGVNLWLLGHTHVPFPTAPTSSDRIFCAGTPEPDGLDCKHEGGVWILDLDETHAVAARMVRTGAYRFRETEERIADAGDLERILSTYSDEESRRTVLRLRLEGRVSRETLAGIGPWATRLAQRVLHLDLRGDEVRERLTPELIDAEYPSGSFPHSLLTRLATDADLEGLEIAHELLRETRG